MTAGHHLGDYGVQDPSPGVVIFDKHREAESTL
jgi:hypothetical protein